MRLTLSACPPFSLRAVIESHGWVRLPPFSADSRSGALVRVERLETGRVVELQIKESQGGVVVEARDRLNGAEREEIGRKVWFFEWWQFLWRDRRLPIGRGLTLGAFQGPPLGAEGGISPSARAVEREVRRGEVRGPCSTGSGW